MEKVSRHAQVASVSCCDGARGHCRLCGHYEATDRLTMFHSHSSCTRLGGGAGLRPPHCPSGRKRHTRDAEAWERLGFGCTGPRHALAPSCMPFYAATGSQHTAACGQAAAGDGCGEIKPVGRALAGPVHQNSLRCGVAGFPMAVGPSRGGRTGRALRWGVINRRGVGLGSGLVLGCVIAVPMPVPQQSIGVMHLRCHSAIWQSPEGSCLPHALGRSPFPRRPSRSVIRRPFDRTG